MVTYLELVQEDGGCTGQHTAGAPDRLNARQEVPSKGLRQPAEDR